MTPVTKEAVKEIIICKVYPAIREKMPAHHYNLMFYEQ